jgi:hypothetical protein
MKRIKYEAEILVQQSYLRLKQLQLSEWWSVLNKKYTAHEYAVSHTHITTVKIQPGHIS